MSLPQTALANDHREFEPRPVHTRWPHHDEDEVRAVVQVLESGRVNSLVHGDECRAFEREFADFVGVSYGISVSNGTVSLEVALRALGIGPGDEVILPARSFFASLSCVMAVGATPVIADIDLDSQNILPESIETLVTAKTKAILCVHLAGWPCDMDRILEICDKHDIFLIEDCAQAHGATYRGRPVGSFGHASSFSFCTDKIMSTGGEGGMLLLKDENVWARAWAYKDHGKNPQKLFGSTRHVVGEFRYVHDSFGSNFRMTEMQAAIGRIQLRKLPDWVNRRRENAALLTKALSGHPAIYIPELPEYVGHAYYKFYLHLRPEALPKGKDRRDIIAELGSLGINCGVGSCPDMSRESAFGNQPPRMDGDLANAASVGESTLIFAVDHLATTEDMQSIAWALESALS
ncbi:MAG: DegT/DnrJ/EryC1/StrS family aminotransferase [Sphingorhabdus sp.]